MIREPAGNPPASAVARRINVGRRYVLARDHDMKCDDLIRRLYSEQLLDWRAARKFSSRKALERDHRADMNGATAGPLHWNA